MKHSPARDDHVIGMLGRSERKDAKDSQGDEKAREHFGLDRND